MLLFVGEEPHRPELGEEFMPYGWCGGCEVCDRYTVPVICGRCSYWPDGLPYWRDPETGALEPKQAVLWPCPHALPILEVTGGCPRSTTPRREAVDTAADRR